MQLDCWQVLELAPTDDERAIKRAYAAKLRHNKPDQHPEGFRQLREAYEQALDIRLYYADFIDYDADDDESEEESETEESQEKFAESETGLDNDHYALDATVDDYIADGYIADDCGDENDDEKLNPIVSATPATANEAIFDTAIPHNDNTNEPETEHQADHLENARHLEKTIEKVAAANLDDNIDDFDQSEISDYELLRPQDIHIQKALSWQQQWQQQVENSQTHNADSQLLTLLQTQFQAIGQLPLDEQYDFEESLLVWLSGQPLYYPVSYAASKAYFDWDQRLLSWDEEDYPWQQLRPLDSGYQQVLNFGSHSGFRQYLSDHYPLVAQYLTPSDLLPTNAQGQALAPVPKLAISRWQFFRKLFVPASALALSSQLEALQEELTLVDQGFAHSYGGADSDMARLMEKLTQAVQVSDTDSPMQFRNPAHYWQNYAPLLTLRQWLMGRFVRKEDLFKLAGVGALFVAVLWGIDKGILHSPLPWWTYLYEIVGVSLVLVMALAVWQLFLMLYTRPYRFINTDRYHVGNLTWLLGSAAMWLLFTSLWMESSASRQVGVPHELSYYVANLAGFSFLLALNTRHDNLLLIQIIWYWALAMLSFNVIYPLLMLISENGDAVAVALDLHPAEPASWIFALVPMLLINAARIEPFSWVEPIADWLVGALLILLIPLFFMIVMLFNHDLLPKLHLGWLGVALTLFWTAMAYSLFKSIRILNRDPSIA